MRNDVLNDKQVFIARVEDRVRYSESLGLSRGAVEKDRGSVDLALHELLRATDPDSNQGGAVERNPFEKLIRPGDSVALKPNWVFHENRSGFGLDCLITHSSIVSSVLDFVLRAKPGKVVVGDAPIQGCDLQKLMDIAGYDSLRKQYARAGAPVEWRDFRRTVLANPEGVWDCQTGLRPLEDYVEFDLGEESLLEPISRDSDRFRVTMYNPELMLATHAPGRHQYLIAREVIEANLVINLPKLKTHKKTCITGALKNLVGINGNKDYLPHHRLGGSRTGGDCYSGGNPFKLASEHLSDAANRREGMSAHLLRQAMRGTYGLARLTGADNNLEGSWHGNDTIWRTCLDLNRILLYGRPDGRMADTPQRNVLSVTDAIVCGEGEGPLAPTPHRIDLLTLAANAAAAEYAHAHLMGFDWRKIPLIREAFGEFRYPICAFRPEDVEIQFGGQRFPQPWPEWENRPFAPPEGWKGQCERAVQTHEKGSL